QKAYAQINATLVELYWSIGKHISIKAKQHSWGKSVVEELSNFIKEKEPNTKGFTARNMWRMKQFYETYKENLKLSTVMTELPQNTNNIFKDIYSLEFLNLNQKHTENNLQQALVSNLKDFILEIGKDFTFMGQEYKVQVGNKDFCIDLLFFHRELQCMVVFELKTDEFSPSYLGQLEFYLEALDRDVKKEHENPSIGILLCREKNDEVVKYALNRSMSPAIISKYDTQLIPKKLLQDKLNEIYELLESENE
ncbi:MAG: PDDEXK nuclease domain-containing protein, partial [Campylobacterota bacterium]|nr:PDDEXK nuclease domain-containing protein [Campylobacterota bacterium]